MPSKKLICGKCNERSPVSSTRCVHCGERLLPNSKIITWDRKQLDLAQRFDLSEDAKHFKKTLRISNGTNALMIVGAECKGVLLSGEYDEFGNTLRKCGVLDNEKTVSIIFVDVAEISISYKMNIGDLQTLDGYHVGVAGNLTAIINEPEDFYQNYFKNRYSMRVSDIERDLHEPLLYTIKNVVSNCLYSNLHGNAEINAKLEAAIISHANYVLDSKGIAVLEMNWIRFEADSPAIGQFFSDRKCQNCGKLIPLGLKHCPYCDDADIIQALDDGY